MKKATYNSKNKKILDKILNDKNHLLEKEREIILSKEKKKLKDKDAE
jgi:hypothetical protein